MTPEDIVAGVQAQDPDALDALAEVARNFAGLFEHRYRFTPQHQGITDSVHDLFLILLKLIQDGQIRHPGALYAIAARVAHYLACDAKDRRVRAPGQLDEGLYGIPDRRAQADAHTLAYRAQQLELAHASIRLLKPRHREILSRFYLFEQPMPYICETMSLTRTQFRLMKNKAKTAMARVATARLKAAA